MTLRFQVDPAQPDLRVLAEAARFLREGSLVAFPTETVYGLGASIFQEAAVQRIFATKGRPANHPLIVHIAEISQVAPLVSEWTPMAQQLADQFWPGPLTLIVPCSSLVSDSVTGGLHTVALRIPAHPVARALLQAAAVPVAAPSANPHTRISPTTADHVATGLGNAVDVLVDGGPCTVGIESTVVSLVGTPSLLRPGGIPRSALEAVLGPLATPTEGPIQSPGQAPLHYSPKAGVVLVSSDTTVDGNRIRYGISPTSSATECVLPDDPAGYAAGLYAALHALDHGEPLYIDRPPETPAWEAVWDRLRRAAGPRKS